MYRLNILHEGILPARVQENRPYNTRPPTFIYFKQLGEKLSKKERLPEERSFAVARSAASLMSAKTGS
jgi:hypothetical protein